MSYDYYPEDHDKDCPSLNVANGNAHIPANIMGIVFGVYQVPFESLGAALDALRELDPERHTRETEHPAANVTLCGCPASQIEWYKFQLAVIIGYCKAKKCALRWG